MEKSALTLKCVYVYAASLCGSEASKAMMDKAEVFPMSPEARIAALKNAPPNGWAAFSEDEERLIAYGATYDEVVRRSEENGVSDPVVVKVPPSWTDLVL